MVKFRYTPEQAYMVKCLNILLPEVKEWEPDGPTAVMHHLYRGTKSEPGDFRIRLDFIADARGYSARLRIPGATAFSTCWMKRFEPVVASVMKKLGKLNKELTRVCGACDNILLRMDLLRSAKREGQIKEH